MNDDEIPQDLRWVADLVWLAGVKAPPLEDDKVWWMINASAWVKEMLVTDDVLCYYTVYFNPSDLEPGYAVRQWRIEPGGPIAGPVLAQGLKRLDHARSVVPQRADTWLDRSASDDPTIVETWI